MPAARLDTTAADFEQHLRQLLHWDMSADDGVEASVRDILAQVRNEGDAAVLSLTNRLDRLSVTDMSALTLSMDDVQAALERISNTDRSALEQAAERIRAYHEHQVDNSWSYTDELGNVLGQKITPLDRVGVYVPGGQAS